MLYDRNPQAVGVKKNGKHVSGGYNYRRPISPVNPLKGFYMQAAENFLEVWWLNPVR